VILRVTNNDASKLTSRLRQIREAYESKGKIEGRKEMTHIEDTERSVTEIEMLKVVLFLVSMGRRAGDREEEDEKGE